MVITRASEYAIRAILYLARQEQGVIVYKRDICREQDITPAFLTKILQPLIRKGIVGSQRGVGGGFYLMKLPAQISLLDIVEAEEGEIFLNQCLNTASPCEREGDCAVHDAWDLIKRELKLSLAKYDFATLVEMEKKKSGKTC